uniref:Uncharacterized protein n=1 Tax=Zea mays TaxID=4577 RepID=B4FEA7_MAIZE|nr:unknown [Zea mays]
MGDRETAEGGSRGWRFLPLLLPFRFFVGKEAEARKHRGGAGGGQEAPRVPLLQEDSWPIYTPMHREGGFSTHLAGQICPKGYVHAIKVHHFMFCPLDL